MPERERIDTGTDKRYVRRDDQGKFKESDDVGRSHGQDQQRDSKTDNPGGQGDRGDRSKAAANGGRSATQAWFKRRWARQRWFQAPWARLDRAWAPNGPWRW